MYIYVGGAVGHADADVLDAVIRDLHNNELFSL